MSGVRTRYLLRSLSLNKTFFASQHRMSPYYNQKGPQNENPNKGVMGICFVRTSHKVLWEFGNPACKVLVPRIAPILGPFPTHKVYEKFPLWGASKGPLMDMEEVRDGRGWWWVEFPFIISISFCLMLCDEIVSSSDKFGGTMNFTH